MAGRLGIREPADEPVQVVAFGWTQIDLLTAKWPKESI